MLKGGNELALTHCSTSIYALFYEARNVGHELGTGIFVHRKVIKQFTTGRQLNTY
jgi:hypothetical protein